MLQLPQKGQVVSLAWIERFCVENDLLGLWNIVKADPPRKPFKSDGCSGGWPDRWGKYDLYPACFKHDLKYWANYPWDNVQRLIVDAELMVDVVEITNNIYLAQIMFEGVRAGGGAMWGRPYSFGFGRV